MHLLNAATTSSGSIQQFFGNLGDESSAVSGLLEKTNTTSRALRCPTADGTSSLSTPGDSICQFGRKLLGSVKFGTEIENVSLDLR